MEYLTEAGGGVIEALKALVKSGQRGKVFFKNGESANVTIPQAEKILETYRELNSSNKVKFIIMVNKNLTDFTKALSFSTTN